MFNVFGTYLEMDRDFFHYQSEGFKKRYETFEDIDDVGKLGFIFGDKKNKFLVIFLHLSSGSFTISMLTPVIFSTFINGVRINDVGEAFLP